MWKTLTLAGVVGIVAAGDGVVTGCIATRPSGSGAASVTAAVTATAARPTGPGSTANSLATPAGDSLQPELSTAAMVAILMAPQPAAPMTLVRIGPAELDPATPINPPFAGAPVFVDAAALTDDGTRTRIAFDTPDLRMLLWVSSSAVARYIAADLVLPQPPSFGTEPSGFAKLRAGAIVETLSQRDGKIEIRHLGGLQVTGAVSRNALTRSVLNRRAGPPTGFDLVPTVPGGLIRQQPAIVAPVVATVNTAYQLVRLRSVDATWDEVAYSDVALEVRGYYAKSMPLDSRNGQWRQRSQLSLENAGDTALPAATCLYASVGGAMTGVIKKNTNVIVTAHARSGWFTVELATHWGPLNVALRAVAPTTGHRFASCSEP